MAPAVARPCVYGSDDNPSRVNEKPGCPAHAQWYNGLGNIPFTLQ